MSRADVAHAHGNELPKLYKSPRGVARSRTRIYPPEGVADYLQARFIEVLTKREYETWTDFSSRVGLSKETIWELRNGRIPSLGVLLAVCKFSRKTPNWFLGYGRRKPHE